MKDQEKDQVPGPGEENVGFDRRRLLGTAGAVAVGALAGLSGGGAELMAARRSGDDPVVEWGPRVNLASLRDNFAPQEVKEFTVPPGGIDNLGLHSVDVFEIPGHGQFEVEFRGYFRVAREHPTSKVWGASTIRVNIVDLKLFGQHEKLGEIRVTLNPDILATGQIFPNMSSSMAKEEPAQCRIAVGAVFNVTGIRTALFNKEPILLMNEHITKIPPVDDPNGHALLFKLPLFNVEDPNGEPVAFLTSLRYGADNYLTRDEVEAIRARRLGRPT